MGWRDVVASVDEGDIGQLEALDNLILGGEQGESTTHGTCPHREK
jgi:hypothetical protein